MKPESDWMGPIYASPHFLVDCLMGLEVSKEWLANTLFNAKVGWVNGDLQVVYERVILITTIAGISVRCPRYFEFLCSFDI